MIRVVLACGIYLWGLRGAGVLYEVWDMSSVAGVLVLMSVVFSSDEVHSWICGRIFEV